jgi:hypothetical protein
VTPEGKVKAEIKKVLHQHGAWYYMPIQNGMGVTGIPDFIVCLHGRFLGIECKAPGKEHTVTANQQKQLSGIAAAQGYSCVATSGDQVESWLTGLNLI